MTYFCLLVENCLAIPQGKIYSVDEGHYGHPGSLLILFVPFIVIIAVIVALKYLTRYKDAAAEGVAEAIGVTFGILSNGIVTLLKVFLFGIGLFSLIMFFVFLSKFEPFCNFGIVYEKFMMILFAIIAFGGPSVYKNFQKRLQKDKTKVQQDEKQKIRVPDIEKGMVDLGLSVLWADTNYTRYMTWREIRTQNIFTNGLRFPTKKEMEELINKCKWRYLKINEDIDGYRVTGPSGNSIFLPSTYERGDRKIDISNSSASYISSDFADNTHKYILRWASWKNNAIPHISIENMSATSNSFIAKRLVKKQM